MCLTKSLTPRSNLQVLNTCDSISYVALLYKLQQGFTIPRHRAQRAPFAASDAPLSRWSFSHFKFSFVYGVTILPPKMWESLKFSRNSEGSPDEEGLLSEKVDTLPSPSIYSCSHCLCFPTACSLLRSNLLPWILVAALSTLLLATSSRWMTKQHPEILLYCE